MILQELRAQRDYFADLTRWTSIELLWENAGWIESVWGARVSPNFFSFWNVRPWLGRTFASDEGRPDAAPVVVVSHAFWMNQLGGDPGWVGKPLRFGDSVFHRDWSDAASLHPPQFLLLLDSRR